MVELCHEPDKEALLLDERDPGKSGTQELVQGLAAGLGIEPTSLVFRWDREQAGAADRLLTLTIYLGRKSEVLSFSEELVRSSAENAYPFIVKYTEYILGVLRKLKQAQ